MAREVEAQWAAAGADRNLWPPLAQEEIENIESRLSALQAAWKAAQHQLKEAQEGGAGLQLPKSFSSAKLFS